MTIAVKSLSADAAPTAKRAAAVPAAEGYCAQARRYLTTEIPVDDRGPHPHGRQPIRELARHHDGPMLPAGAADRKSVR